MNSVLGRLNLRRSRGNRVSPSRGTRSTSERLLFGLLGFAVVVVIWEASMRLGFTSKVLLSAPSLILEVAITDFGSGSIWPHLWTSFVEWTLGFMLALVVGIPLGMLLGMFRSLYYLLDPWLSALYATPTVALIPLIILTLGIGLGAKLFIVFFETVITVTVVTLIGVQATERRHLDIAQSFRANGWLRFKSVILPGSVPHVLTGVRLGVGRALVGVVVAELFAANSGIGFYIGYSGALLQTSRVMLGIVILGIWGMAIAAAAQRIQAHYAVWQPSIRNA